MLPRFNTNPVAPEKIQLIHDMLNDPEVKTYYKIWTLMNHANNQGDRSLIKARFKAWHDYVVARDKFLGLPTLNPYFLNRLENSYGK